MTTSDEQSPGKFDAYVRVLGRVSAAVSGVLFLMALIPCGNIASALFSILQTAVLLALMWLPMSWHRLKGKRLEKSAATWALIASLAVFAVLTLSLVFDGSSRHGCFR